MTDDLIVCTLIADYQENTDPRFFDFQPGNPTRMCTRVTIEMDGFLEMVENLFADLSVVQADRIVFDPMRTQIVILDSDGELAYNITYNL